MNLLWKFNQDWNNYKEGDIVCLYRITRDYWHMKDEHGGDFFIEDVSVLDAA